jgi:cytochrome c oxidase assembly protein subunit 15
MPLPRWLHLWAVITVCATFVLLFLGAVVTTFRVGMADQVWPTFPWHLLLISWDEPSAGFLIEHSHRLAGYIVGCCVIVLAIGLWRCDPRRWVRRLGLLALLGVIVQGLLGGFRVRLNALLGTDLAVIHGCFAQIVFALLVTLALVTSARWLSGAARLDAQAFGLKRWAIFTAGLIYLQIVLGAIMRHTYSVAGQRGHLVIAFGVVAAFVWLLKLALEERDRSLLASIFLLGGFLLVQVLLGVEAWVQRVAAGPAEMQERITIAQATVRTAHVLVGFCIFSTAVAITLRAHWILGTKASLAQAPAGHLEGVV